MKAARSPPRSEPQNIHDRLPRAIRRRARSAALFDRPMRLSSRNGVNVAQRLSWPMALATSLPRASLARCSRIQASRSATSGALSSWRTALRSLALRPLIPRSISNKASIMPRGSTFHTAISFCAAEADISLGRSRDRGRSPWQFRVPISIGCGNRNDRRDGSARQNQCPWGSSHKLTRKILAGGEETGAFARLCAARGSEMLDTPLAAELVHEVMTWSGL
jgi:hypothetical protein